MEITYGAWRSPVAHLLWEPLSGAGGCRPATEMLDFCVSCVGGRRWVTTQFWAQLRAARGPTARIASSPHRILVTKPVFDPNDEGGIRVLMNSHEELKRLVPN
jgi:hypothetical protein